MEGSPYGKVWDLLEISGITELAVPGEGVVYTGVFIPPERASFSWWVKFDGPGDVKVKVELEQAIIRPADGVYDAVSVVPENKLANPLFPEILDKLLHTTAYAPNVSPYVRLKITGLSGNDSGTLLKEAKIVTIEN